MGLFWFFFFEPQIPEVRFLRSVFKNPLSGLMSKTKQKKKTITISSYQWYWFWNYRYCKYGPSFRHSVLKMIPWDSWWSVAKVKRYHTFFCAVDIWRCKCEECVWHFQLMPVVAVVGLMLQLHSLPKADWVQFWVCMHPCTEGHKVFWSIWVSSAICPREPVLKHLWALQVVGFHR